MMTITKRTDKHPLFVLFHPLNTETSTKVRILMIANFNLKTDVAFDKHMK